MMRNQEGGRVRPLIRVALRVSTAVIALSAGAAAAQEQEARDEAQPAPDSDGRSAEIIITGARGSAITGIEPVAVLDRNALDAIGATNMDELLRALRSVSQSADGSEPIFLLNAQRISGYQEIGSLPPEAIEKVEVLPEPAALKFGYPRRGVC